jgi:hypothetical protein
MSASQCHCLGPTGDGGRRAAIGLLGAMIVLGAGLLQPGRSRAQETPAKAEAAKGSDPAQVQESVEPLSVRYRFSETYSVDEKPAKPELIGSYQVGSLETVRVEVEKAQGAPDRNEGTIQAIYTERPAKVTKLGEVTDLIRYYDEFRPGGSFQAVPAQPPLVKGLLLWCRFQRAGLPLIMSLTDQRPLREEEFGAITGKIFLPQLASILPPTPSRVGDAWKITPRTSRSLLGNAVPDDGEFDVEGTLVDVRRAANGTTLTARIEISGRLTIDRALAAVKAWIFFEFEPPPPLEPGAKPKAGASTGIIEARGHISRVQMARRLSIPQDEDGRFHKIVTKELDLRRRPASNLLKTQDPPVADKANSWLRYEDPEGRFHFDHPQQLSVDLVQSNRIDLVDHRPDGSKDALAIMLPPNERQYRDPEYLRRILKEQWDRTDFQVVTGDASWLPNPEWAPLKRKVYRLEAAARPTAPGPGGQRIERIYLDYYLVEFVRNENLHVVAMTIRNDHPVFARLAEDVIKSFEFDQGQGARVPPSRPSAATAPSGRVPADTAPSAPPARRPAPPVPQGRP